MKYNPLFLLLILLSSTLAQAQEPRGGLALGQWQSHLPYNRGVSVTQSQDKVFFATTQSLFTVDKEEHSVELFNKVSGLSDMGIQTIRYRMDSENPDKEVLLIAYSNSNIDLIRNSGITNITDIKRKSITGDKRINHIFFKDEFAWLACGFGIVKLDLDRDEIRFTTFTDTPVNAIGFYGEYLYASTNSGIFRAPDDGSLNLLDFNNWELLSTNIGFPASYQSNTSAVFDGKFFTNVNDTLFAFDGTTWANFFHQNNYQFNDMYAGADILYLNMVSPSVDRIIRLTANQQASIIYNNDLTGRTPISIEDEAGNLWVADYFQGNSLFSADGVQQKFSVEGPYSISVGNISFFEGELWMGATNLEPKWNYKGSQDGFASYINGEWNTDHRFGVVPSLDLARDITNVVVHPQTRHVFAGSFRGGLIEYDRENYITHKYGSSLQAPPLDTSSYRVSGLAFDADNNLWISNYAAPAPISVFTNEREWKAFSPSFSADQLTTVIIDQNNYKWFGTKTGGVVVFDSGQDPLDTSDDRYKLLTSSNSVLESNDIRSLVMDLDGYVWVGTSMGVFLFDCTSQVFDNACPGRQPIAQEGGIDDLLLDTESINTIAVDGANRKWFGTGNGIFVLETDADEAIYTFNTENSPLFDNNIVEIAINGESGEVFIGTDKGLISYRANATDGANTFIKNDVYAFPNPVRPDFDGEIAIRGLVTDADVKITDVSGALVYETKALGGQAVWNGRDYNGRKARSGVYLVFATNRDGTKKMVTKLLFIN